MEPSNCTQAVHALNEKRPNFGQDQTFLEGISESQGLDIDFLSLLELLVRFASGHFAKWNYLYNRGQGLANMA